MTRSLRCNFKDLTNTKCCQKTTLQTINALFGIVQPSYPAQALKGDVHLVQYNDALVGYTFNGLSWAPTFNFEGGSEDGFVIISSVAGFPLNPDPTKVYYDKDTNKVYGTNGTIWVTQDKGFQNIAPISGIRPWAKQGDLSATSATNVSLSDSTFHTGKVTLGADVFNAHKLNILTDTDFGIRQKALNLTEFFNYHTLDCSSVQNVGFPNWESRLQRYDLINLPISNLPNMVHRFGFYAADLNLQPSLEEAWEYHYIFQGKPACERHIEFWPIGGAPSQRWISFAGHWDGTYTAAQIVGNLFNLIKASGTQMIKIEDQGDGIATHFRFIDGVEFQSNIGVISFSADIKLIGVGNIYNENNGYINLGKLGNANETKIYGRTDGACLRIASGQSAIEWQHYMWGGGFGIRNVQTGATAIAVSNAVTDTSMWIQSNRVEFNVPLTLETGFAVNGSGAQNGSMFKGVDGALYYKGGAGTVTLVAPN